MAGGTKYHTGIAKAIFDNVIVSMTCFDKKRGGGYKNGFAKSRRVGISCSGFGLRTASFYVWTSFGV